MKRAAVVVVVAVAVAVADWLAGEAMKIDAGTWGWLRDGPIPAEVQLVAWSDGSVKGSEGSFGWILISRGASRIDITLEGLGGGRAPCMDSTGAEALGVLALSEGLRLCLSHNPAPRHWGVCPIHIWAGAYSRVLHQLRPAPAGTWANQDRHIIEYLYEADWAAM